MSNSVSGLLLLLTLAMVACAGVPVLNTNTHWKEEVLLHDGSRIIVTRSVERGGQHEIGQEPPIKEQSLSFTMPDTKQNIAWKDDFSKDVGGANFLLTLLDFDKGTPYLVVIPMGCLSYNKWGRPNPPYVIFKHQAGEWQRIPLQELPDEIEQPNLLHSSPDVVAKKRAVKGIVSAAIIREEIDGYRQPEFRTILRAPIKNEWCATWKSNSFKAPLPSKQLPEQ